MSTLQDISPDFRWNKRDARAFRKIIRYEGTGEAIKAFARQADNLTDYGYWFMLGTLWVSYSGWSELDLWIRLFSSRRPNRLSSLLKPSELQAFHQLPEMLPVFRAHRPNEKRWISYTIVPEIAVKFAVNRGVDAVTQYIAQKSDMLGLFLRRQEFEVLILDQSRVEFVRHIPIVSEVPA